MKRVRSRVSAKIDIPIFRAVAAGFQSIDWVIYSDLLARLDEHDAEVVLETVEIPVAIVTGEQRSDDAAGDRRAHAPRRSRARAWSSSRAGRTTRRSSIPRSSSTSSTSCSRASTDGSSPREGSVMIECPACGAEALEIDVKCGNCGSALGSSGAHRMIGAVMLGQYELVDVIGQGGMSIVYKARHKLTDQEVALKILPPELAAHSQVKSRFLEEAKALAALDHQNIVHLYNFGQENQSFVLAMQYVQGRTWERMILENKRLDWQTTTRIAVDVLRALEYAHGRGVVHRDMKPSNVLVRAHDGAATVMDFGIAKMTTSTRLTAEGQTMGTVRYMSPEQVRGHEVSLHTDIYSLGATFYESLVGDTPFDGQTHFEIMTKHLSEVPRRPSEHGVRAPADVEDALRHDRSPRRPRIAGRRARGHAQGARVGAPPRGRRAGRDPAAVVGRRRVGAKRAPGGRVAGVADPAVRRARARRAARGRRMAAPGEAAITRAVDRARRRPGRRRECGRAGRDVEEAEAGGRRGLGAERRDRRRDDHGDPQVRRARDRDLRQADGRGDRVALPCRAHRDPEGGEGNQVDCPSAGGSHRARRRSTLLLAVPAGRAVFVVGPVSDGRAVPLDCRTTLGRPSVDVDGSADAR